jgi:hypothetical protein
LTANTGKEDSEDWRFVVLDECGNPQWSLPKFSIGVELVGFDDDLLVMSAYGTDTSTPKWALHRYSIEGTLLAGPAEGRSVFEILGADGVFYVGYCVDGIDNPHRQDLEVVALSPSLEVIDRLHVGPTCRSVSAVLLDDGLMLVVREGSTRTEILRIATASPGLAHTAWPTDSRDNARTGWLAPW